jgi:fluoroquinolone transport system permease protein
MKIKALIIGDILLQYKYGFYYIYLFFTLFYIALISALPTAWRNPAATLLIFTDPAALGMFFMGALVLYEKGERALDSLAVSPVRPHEYVLSKIISLSIIATATASAIALYAGLATKPAYFLFGVFFGSSLFSALGLIVAVQIKTLNEFIIYTTPLQLIINIPAFFYAFAKDSPWLLFHPGSSIIELLRSGSSSLPAVAILLTWTIAMYLFACRVVKKAFESLGGVKI